MKIDRIGCGLELKFDAGNGAQVGTFKGYGSIFGNMDQGGDVVAKGAFKATLREWKKRGKLPKMLLQHGGFIGPAEDGIPVGKYSVMEEDEKGLYLEGSLFALDTQKGKYIYEGMSSGELDGLSIGYVAQEVEYGKLPTDPRRTLKKIELREVSIVTFPMNKASTVETVKSIEDFKNLSDAEAYLRDVAGMTQRQAVAFVSRIKGLSPSDSETASDADLVRHLTNMTSTRFKGA
jgi:HK97 family phage prohead protease